jgi:hypothetical protein
MRGRNLQVALDFRMHAGKDKGESTSAALRPENLTRCWTPPFGGINEGGLRLHHLLIWRRDQQNTIHPESASASVSGRNISPSTSSTVETPNARALPGF